MLCPECQSDSRVIDSRDSEHGRIRRRRECLKSGHRFTTYEVQASELDRITEVESLSGDLVAAAARINEVATVAADLGRPSAGTVKRALIAAREARGLSLSEAAAKAGLDYGTYYRIEKQGRYLPRTFARIAAGYGLTPKELIAAAAPIPQETT